MVAPAGQARRGGKGQAMKRMVLWALLAAVLSSAGGCTSSRVLDAPFSLVVLQAKRLYPETPMDFGDVVVRHGRDDDGQGLRIEQVARHVGPERNLTRTTWITVRELSERHTLLAVKVSTEHPPLGWLALWPYTQRSLSEEMDILDRIGQHVAAAAGLP